MKSKKIRLLFVSFAFVFYCAYTQNISQINSYTFVPNINKISISASYYKTNVTEFSNDKGEIFKNGTKSYITDLSGEKTQIDEYKFSLLHDVLNVRIDYYNKKKSGAFLEIPLILNSTINGKDIYKNSSVLGDVLGGIYFLWDEIYHIQQIKSEFFVKYSKIFLPGSTVGYYFGTGSFQYGSSFAISFLLSEKATFSNKIVFTNTPETELKTSSDASLFIGPTSYLDFMSKYTRTITRKTSIGVDFNYYSFISKQIRIAGGSNKKVKGSFAGITPLVGITVLSDKKYGYILIQNCNLIAGLTLPISFNNYIKPQIFKIGFNLNFE